MAISKAQPIRDISALGQLEMQAVAGTGAGSGTFPVATSAFVAVVVLIPLHRSPAGRAAVSGAVTEHRLLSPSSQEGDPMKALLIDDHPLILSALQAVIEGLGPGVSVVGVGGARAARETLAADAGFDLVLLDLQLADADGFELLGELRAAHPSLPVVVVSASDKSADVLRAIDLGAMGFVPKRASNQTLFDALHMVMSGGIYVPPVHLRSYASADRRPAAMGETDGWGVKPEDAPRPADAKPRAPLAALGLTPRQTDVLALLLQGQPNKLIARELKLSVETVKDHVAAVLRTLNVSSRTQAVLAVSQMSHQGALVAWREARHGEARQR